jgi:hypothetical protein
MKKPDTPVGWVGLSFDQAVRLKLVDDTHKRDRLEIEQFRQSSLVDSLVLRKICQNLPLGSRQSRSPRLLIEALFEKPRNVV